VSKNNTGSLPLRGILPVTTKISLHIITSAWLREFGAVYW